MIYDVTPAVTQVGQMEFSGNIIPELWYKNIRRRGGEKRPTDKAYLEAINILAEIVYWYRPTLHREESTGKLIRVTKKFAGDFLQRSYDALADKFHISKDEVRGAIIHLECLGLVKRHFRTIDVAIMDGATVRQNNVLYLELFPSRVWEITCTELHPSPRSETAENTPGTKDVISEKDIEDYLFENPQRLKFGGKHVNRWIKRQYAVPSGIIDLLGIVRDGTIAVVEVKNVAVEAKALTQVCRYAFDIQSIMPGVKIKKIVVGRSIDTKTFSEAEAVGVQINTFTETINSDEFIRLLEWTPEAAKARRKVYGAMTGDPELMHALIEATHLAGQTAAANTGGKP